MKFFKITLLLAFVCILSSCGADECQICTVTQVLSVDGMEEIRQTLNIDQEFCGEDLDAIKASESSVTQDVGGIMSTTVVTVDCN